MNVHMTGDYRERSAVLAEHRARCRSGPCFHATVCHRHCGASNAENAGSASALFNMMRNLGGAVGIAGLQTFLTKREQFHSNILTNSVTRL